MARLDRPHIEAVHDASTGPGSVYLVTELVEGGSVADLLTRGPQPGRPSGGDRRADCGGAVIATTTAGSYALPATDRGAVYGVRPSTTRATARGWRRPCTRDGRYR